MTDKSTNTGEKKRTGPLGVLYSILYTILINPLLTLLDRPINYIYRLSYVVGALFLRFLKKIKRRVARFIRPVLRWLYYRLARVFKYLKYLLNKFFKDITLPFKKLGNLFVVMGEGSRQAKTNGKNGLVGAVAAIFKAFKRNIFVFKRFLNYAFPVVTLLLLAAVIISITGQQYALVTYVPGGSEPVAVVLNENDYRQAQKDLQSRIRNLSGDFMDTTPTYELVPLTGDLQTTSSGDIIENLIKASGREISAGNGVYIDGEFLAATSEVEGLNALLKARILPYEIANPDAVSIQFTKDVTTDSELLQEELGSDNVLDEDQNITETLYLSETLVPLSNIEDIFNTEETPAVTYTAVLYDTLYRIATKTSVPLEHLLVYNPQYEAETRITAGEIVVLDSAKPYLQVEVSRLEAYNEEVDFLSEREYDSTLALGTTHIEQEGEKGVNAVEATITYVDGIEVSRVVTQSTVIKEPVNQKIKVGTKAYSSGGSYGPIEGSGEVVGSGRYAWPVGGNGGYLSMPFRGYYGHNGMDIAGSGGTPILAVDDGEVILSQTYYNFGKTVMVDHGNGIVTLYAHCSSLYASVGQKVTRGTVIAGMGQTGNATGNHLHIEFRVNGGAQNPASFIGQTPY